MASSTVLSAEIRSRLETVRRILGLSQKQLADLAGISQGNVSNCLKGRSVRLDSVRRLLNAFAAAATSEQGLSLVQETEMQDAVDAARRSIDGCIESQSHLARPGAPMPENATNRIERAVDKKIRQAFGTGPFTAAVVGPPESGKSTFLGLMAAEAQRRGFSVVEFDARHMLPSAEPVEEAEEEDLTAEFFRELAYEVASTLGSEDQEEHRRVDGRLAFFRFIIKIRRKRPVPPLLIIVDHASELPPALLDLAQLCRSMGAKKGATQVSWAIEASSHIPTTRVGVLSRLNPSPLAAVTLFDRGEILKLGEAYEVEDFDIIDDLDSWLCGQPFLTHTALSLLAEVLGSESVDRENAWGQVKSKIELCQGSFAQHLSRIRDGVRRRNVSFGAFEESWNSVQTMDEFVNLCSRPENSDLKMIAIGEGIFRQRAEQSDFEVCRFYQQHLFTR